MNDFNSGVELKFNVLPSRKSVDIRIRRICVGVELSIKLHNAIKQFFSAVKNFHCREWRFQLIQAAGQLNRTGAQAFSCARKLFLSGCHHGLIGMWRVESGKSHVPFAQPVQTLHETWWLALAVPISKWARWRPRRRMFIWVIERRGVRQLFSVAKWLLHGLCHVP